MKRNTTSKQCIVFPRRPIVDFNYVDLHRGVVSLKGLKPSHFISISGWRNLLKELRPWTLFDVMIVLNAEVRHDMMTRCVVDHVWFCLFETQYRISRIVDTGLLKGIIVLQRMRMLIWRKCIIVSIWFSRILSISKTNFTVWKHNLRSDYPRWTIKIQWDFRRDW